MKPTPESLPATVEALEAGTVLIINKPLTWTSFDVVAKLKSTLRRHFGIKKLKIGHAGTLDPLATGVLVVCVGKATKTIDQWMSTQKSYTAQVKLGFTTPSFDAETQEIPFVGAKIPVDTAKIEAALTAFRGDILQVPPLYSALKIGGQTLYKMARKGHSVDIPPRPVTIHRLDLLSYHVIQPNEAVLEIAVDCSKGTYIRSLANDLGDFLGCGGYLIALERTASGEKTLDDAWELSDLLGILEEGKENA